MLLENKVVFVTGAARGIGKGIVECFAANGAIVYANDIIEGSIENHTGNVIPLYFDITDTSAAKAAIMRIKKEQGKLDCLVNNAGIMKDSIIGMVDSNDILKTFQINVFAVIEMTQLAVRVMTKQNSGSIINIASIVGVNGNKGQIVYSASKGAVIALTKTSAKELAPKNIRVNAIAPGMIDTEMFRSIGEEKSAERLANVGMGRLGTTEDVAKACLFLASDLSGYVTGQIIGVDGAAIV